MPLMVRLSKQGGKLEDPDSGLSIRLDAEGRWSSFRIQGRFYRRCLDGQVVQGAEAHLLDKSQAQVIYQQVWAWLNRLNSSESLIVQSQSYTPEAYQALSQHYFDAYPEPVSILPPDRYGDLVIQPARGCPNRRCRFCAFYKDKPYAVLNKSQLEQHLRDIERLFGKAIYARQGIFLGSANAMALSQRRLTDCLQLINRRLGAVKRGVAAFADPDFSAPRTEADWQALYKLGLRHIVIGLETGWSALRTKLGKSGDLTQVQRMIEASKRQGITVGLTVLTGAAKQSGQHQQIEETVSFLAQQSLTEKDIVYLSPLNNKGTVEQNAYHELFHLKKKLKEEIAAKVVSYQMQRFNYYA